MIPKVIHYCWFGHGKYPEIVVKCIDSWRRFCPDYEFRLWNEDNYDINKIDYIKEAYKLKKWAFVSDYARLDVIYREGGIYLDTDVELIKNLDELLNFKCFLAADGSGINTGLGFGAEKNSAVISEMMKLYQNRKFITPAGPDLTPCTQMNSHIFLQKGYDLNSKEMCNIFNATILPPEFFNPISGPQSELNITPNTYGIHWSSRLWETGLTRWKADIRMKLGIKTINKIKRIIKRNR